jgi:uncharacterized membrane protein YkoI
MKLFRFTFAILPMILVCLTVHEAKARDQSADGGTEVIADSATATLAAGTAVETSVPHPASGQRTASEGQKSSLEDEFHAVKDATRRGVLMPFEKLQQRVQHVIPGDVVRVQLFRRSEQNWVYEIAVLSNEGRYTFAVVNARTGSIIRQRMK